MKILLLSSTNNIHNGYGNITHEMCSFLNEKVDFKLLLPENEQRYDYTNYPTEYVLPKYIFNVKTPGILDYLRFSYKTDADIIHSFFEVPYAFLGARLAKKNHKPFIVGTQGTYAIRPLFMWPERYILKHIYNAAKIITTPSQFTKENIIKYSGTKSPVEMIHNGVNFERFQEDFNTTELRHVYGDKKILLTVGGLKPRKGQDVVIEALGILKKKRSDFHYVCAGSGKFLMHLKDLVRQKNLNNNVSFLGELDGKNLVKYYKLCDIYIHTPRVIDWNFEGFGIVYLEASACRKPIIAADSGGIRDAVIADKTGLIVPENDPISTAQAIERLLDSTELGEQLGNNGWQYAKEHDWAIIGEKFINLYKKL